MDTKQLENAQETIISALRILMKDPVTEDNFQAYKVAMELLEGLGDPKLTELYNRSKKTMEYVRRYDDTRGSLWNLGEQALERIEQIL